MRSYTTRDWVIVGLFGALWGVAELTLGSLLHTLFPPQASTFWTGVVLGGIGVALALAGRRFVPRRGSVLLIAVVTALLKLLSPGGTKVGPVVAILVQGGLMEATLLLARAPRRWAFALGGALAIAWNLPHKFLMMGLLYGTSAGEVLAGMVRQGSSTLGLDESLVWPILGALLLIRLLVGAASGWGAWGLGGAVVRRLGRRQEREGGGEPA